MDDHVQLEFEPIYEQDIGSLTAIMTRAFDEDARIHLGEGRRDGPVGYNNGEFLTKWALNASSEAYKIMLNGEEVGACILWINEDGNNDLEILFIDVPFQSSGIGTIIWRMIEGLYPDTKIWRTATPGYSKRNHHFYMDKCGFKLMEVVHPGIPDQETYRLEKRVEN
ncbi:GNAT family N-acetyltransferase [Fontibacillus sp. BL9]|uniref:GNAT family N-acetyltransferase n=1 Tax=Fontibacillus sp. BL9 TaxID=3389971 RepID=UPI00397B56EE